jgi:hypothetical protein
MDKKEQSGSVLPVYLSPDIVRKIKATSILWERHLKRMDNKEMPKRVKNVKIEGCNRAGRKLRWMNVVDEYPNFWRSKR